MWEERCQASRNRSPTSCKCAFHAPLTRTTIILRIREGFRTVVETWRDCWAYNVDRVSFVNFEIYNGAMGVSQSARLRAVLEQAGHQNDVDAIVLTGGYNTLSNGIGLCEIAENRDPAADDVVKEVFSATDKVIVSALRGGLVPAVR